MRAALAAAFGLWASAAEAACRLALVLALDVSGSVDGDEYRLQLDGIAAALEDRAVRDAILALPSAHVNLFVFEWSAGRYQRDIVGWTELASEPDIDRVAESLRAWRRGPAPEATGIGAAMRAAAERLRQKPECWKWVTDLSGDGKNNDWPSIRDVKASGELAGITVNALVIGVSTPRIADDRLVEITELTSYFRTQVLHGPGAFLEVALGYEDYSNAMKRKLLKEVMAPTLGQWPPEVRTGDRLAAGPGTGECGGPGCPGGVRR